MFSESGYDLGKTCVLGFIVALASGCSFGTLTSVAPKQEARPLAVAAEEDLEESSRNGTRSLILMRVAKQLESTGDLVSATEFYRRASALAPQEVVPLLGLARSVTKSGHHRDALLIYRSVLRLDASNVEAMRGLGLNHLYRKEYELAHIRLRDALALEPQSTVTLNALATAYDMLGKHEAAQQHYRAILHQQPEHLAALANLSLSLALSRGYEGIRDRALRAAFDPRTPSRERGVFALSFALAGEEATAQRILTLEGAADKDLAQRAENLRTEIAAHHSSERDTFAALEGKPPLPALLLAQEGQEQEALYAFIPLIPETDQEFVEQEMIFSPLAPILGGRFSAPLAPLLLSPPVNTAAGVVADDS